MPWNTDWRVTVDGKDVSTAMRTYLIDIIVTDEAGVSSDTCTLKFDDAGGHLLLPKSGAAVVVHLQGVQVFEGFVDSTPWELTRGGGRTLGVTAKGDDPRGKTKERQRWHLDDATLKEALEKGAKRAGLDSIIVDPSFTEIKRAYWSMDAMSFAAWATELANQYGGTFKIRGKRAVFAKRGDGASAGGGAMPSIAATIPGNVISVTIDPTRGKRRYSKSTVRYFDRKSASFKSEDVEIDLDDVDVTNHSLEQANDADEAKRFGAGRKSDAERAAGVGSIEMDLAVEAQAEGTLVLSGARPGIDGSYRIISVTHKASRSAGATTVLELAQPQGEAGKDTRKPANVPVPTPAPR